MLWLRGEAPPSEPAAAERGGDLPIRLDGAAAHGGQLVKTINGTFFVMKNYIFVQLISRIQGLLAAEQIFPRNLF
jgi:hypothetical protein